MYGVRVCVCVVVGVGGGFQAELIKYVGSSNSQLPPATSEPPLIISQHCPLLLHATNSSCSNQDNLLKQNTTQEPLARLSCFDRTHAAVSPVGAGGSVHAAGEAAGVDRHPLNLKQ